MIFFDAASYMLNISAMSLRKSASAFIACNDAGALRHRHRRDATSVGTLTTHAQHTMRAYVTSPLYIVSTAARA